MFDVPTSAETAPTTAWTPHRSADSPPVAEPSASGKKCPDALAAEITTLAGHLNAAQYRFLKLLEEFDREQGWAGERMDYSTAIEWLLNRDGVEV